mgnify:FL=1
MDEKDKRIQELSDQLQRAQDALLVLNYYNMIHNDFEDYLLQVSEWGLGERDDMPDPDNFVTGLQKTDALVKEIKRMVAAKETIMTTRGQE